MRIRLRLFVLSSVVMLPVLVMAQESSRSAMSLPGALRWESGAPALRNDLIVVRVAMNAPSRAALQQILQTDPSVRTSLRFFGFILRGSIECGTFESPCIRRGVSPPGDAIRNLYPTADDVIVASAMLPVLPAGDYTLSAVYQESRYQLDANGSVGTGARSELRYLLSNPLAFSLAERNPEGLAGAARSLEVRLADSRNVGEARRLDTLRLANLQSPEGLDVALRLQSRQPEHDLLETLEWFPDGQVLCNRLDSYMQDPVARVSYGIAHVYALRCQSATWDANRPRATRDSDLRNAARLILDRAIRFPDDAEAMLGALQEYRHWYRYEESEEFRGLVESLLATLRHRIDSYPVSTKLAMFRASEDFVARAVGHEGLRRMALARDPSCSDGQSPFENPVQARVRALVALSQLNPSAARETLLLAIRSADPVVDDEVLKAIPLPAGALTDQEILNLLNGRRPRVCGMELRAETLASMYLSKAAAAEDPFSWIPEGPDKCNIPILAYRLKVGDPRAELALRSEPWDMSSRPGTCTGIALACATEMPPAPILTELGIAYLSHKDPTVRESAVQLLRQARDPRATQALLQLSARLSQEGRGPNAAEGVSTEAGIANVEMAMVQSHLGGAVRWLSVEELRQFEARCVTSQCSSAIEQMRILAEAPLRLTLRCVSKGESPCSEPGASLAHLQWLRGEDQILAALRGCPQKGPILLEVPQDLATSERDRLIAHWMRVLNTEGFYPSLAEPGR